MELILHVVELRLRHTFTIATGSVDVQQNLIVELRDGPHRGFGEASTIGYYGNSAHTMRDSLESVRPIIEAASFDEPTAFWDSMLPQLDHDRFALCALDQAAHDLWGQRHQRPVWDLWGLDIANVPPSDYTIGIADIETMVAKLREFPDFPVYKIKLGTPEDLAIVENLRRHAGDAAFRVDANTGWTAEQTLDLAPRLADLGVEFIEQPLPIDDVEGMRRVFAESPLPIVADESCQTEPDVATCAEFFHGVNVKLTKAGGLTPARRMIEDARRRGLRVMVGCMTESSVGIAAIAQLAPLLDWVDMDGALLLADDVASGTHVDLRGNVNYAEQAGLGVVWHGSAE